MTDLYYEKLLASVKYYRYVDNKIIRAGIIRNLIPEKLDAGHSLEYLTKRFLKMDWKFRGSKQSSAQYPEWTELLLSFRSPTI